MSKVRIDITNCHRDDVDTLVQAIQNMDLSCRKRDDRKDHCLRTYYDVETATLQAVRKLCDYLADECWSYEIMKSDHNSEEHLQANGYIQKVVEDDDESPGLPVQMQKVLHRNGKVKRLASINTDQVELEVLECACGYHMGIDSTFLDNVGDFKTVCPSCDRLIDTEIDIPENLNDIKKVVSIYG
jgi:hypothetical protein